MIARLSIPERAEIMREYRGKLLALSESVRELLANRLVPIDMRNYNAVCWMRRDENGILPYDDNDAPLFKRIFTALDNAHDELNERCKELDAGGGRKG